MPLTASISPEFISQIWADIVVEPISIATPNICVFKPGMTAAIWVPARSTTVTCQLAFLNVACTCFRTDKSAVTSALLDTDIRSGHCSIRASANLRRSPDGSCISGSLTSIKHKREGGLTSTCRLSAAFRINC